MNGREFERFHNYHRESPEFGPLHVAMSDGNLEDAYITFCREEAVKMADQEAIVLADILLSMPLEKREHLYDALWALYSLGLTT